MKKLIAINRTVGLAIALTGLGASLGATFAPQAAMAQDPNKKISLNFQNAPIQTVLKTLFNSQGINNTIDSDVQGNVNININDVSFDVALRSLLRSASPPLTFDVQDGIYHIRVKTNTPVATPNITPTPTGDPTSSDVTPAPRSSKMNLYKLPIDRYDAFYIAGLITSKKSLLVPVLPNYAPKSNGSGGGGGGSVGGSSGGGSIGGGSSSGSIGGGGGGGIGGF